MRVGLVLPGGADPAAAVAAARRAEELGFDLVASGEHVFFHGPVPNAMVTLAAVAGATERIGLLSAISLLPVYPAALAAKMAATLALVSGGRFELGVGVGGEFPAELRACGVDPADRGARTDEGLALITRLLAGEEVTHRGRFAELDGLRLDPVPAVAPPVWVGGRRGAATRRAGRFADVWMPYLVEPRQVTRGLAHARTAAVEADRAPGSVGAGLFCWALADDDPVAARREAVAALGRTYRQDFEPLVDRLVPSGRPDTVVERLREYAGAGVDTVLYSPACAPEDHDRAVTLFAREVLPALAETHPRSDHGVA